MEKIIQPKLSTYIPEERWKCSSMVWLKGATAETEISCLIIAITVYFNYTFDNKMKAIMKMYIRQTGFQGRAPIHKRKPSLNAIFQLVNLSLPIEIT